MNLQLLRADITELAIDAIVNAANSSLLGGGGVDGAIHRKGGRAILDECIKIREKQGGCPTGEAVFTTAGNLPSRYVIHTVGPVWQGGGSGEDDLLRNCYLNSLKIAGELGVKTIAFPNISTGVYGFPKRRAADIALKTITQYQTTNTRIEKIIFVCYDEENYFIFKELMQKEE
jgi:O-acetyl-ADP-ribose deacetylase